MSETFKTYVAMSQLGSFTVEDLSEASGVNKVTVSTVLRRFDSGNKGFLTAKTLATGGRGGQPHVYTLNPSGYIKLKTEIGQSELKPLRAHLPDTGGVPLGLMAAEDLINNLISCNSNEPKKMLIEQISNNLDWAEKEVNTVGENNTATHDLQSRINKVRSMLFVELDKTIENAPPEVVITSLTRDKEASSLASFVQGTLSTIMQTVLPSWNSVPIYNISFENLSVHKRTGKHLAQADVFLAMHSGSNKNRAIFKDFEQVAADFNNVVIIDSNDSKWVADAAKRLDLVYQPNAMSLKANDYIDCLTQYCVKS